ncbi:hypothetical protein JCM11491_002556 [Sporobolomyces phaffii]
MPKVRLASHPSPSLGPSPQLASRIGSLNTAPLLFQARTSLVFKGPANPTRRARKPPVEADPIAPPTRPVKKRPTPAVTRAREGDDDQDDLVSDKKKGKRKAVDQDGGGEPVSSLRVDHFHASVALSTVDKTWKPLSETSRDDIEDLAKQIENEFKSELPSNVSKAEFRQLVSSYTSALMTYLEELRLPPFPATLKPRTASKESVDLIDADLVTKKIESTKATIEKEARLIRELEREIDELKRVQAGGVSDREEADAEDGVRDEDEESDVMIVLPVKKRKKAASAENVILQSKDDESVVPPPPRKKAVKKPPKAKPSPAARVSPPPSKTTKSILKPPPAAASAVVGSDDFDSFPILPAASARTKPKSKPKVRTQSPLRAAPATKSLKTAKRPSLAGKKVVPLEVQDGQEKEAGPKRRKKAKE